MLGHSSTNTMTVELVRSIAFKNQPISLPRNANKVQLHCPEAILNQFRSTLSNSTLLGCTFNNPYTNTIETLPSKAEDFTARHLQILARNEAVNVTGHMRTELYNGKLTADQIAMLRCFVKATVISGVTFASHWGGYGYGNTRIAFKEPQKIIIVDQAGLQWQKDFRNSGGMFFYPNSPTNGLPAGFEQWQAQTFKAMYGIDRPSSASENKINVKWYANNLVEGFLDLDQVKNAIDVEFSQALEAVISQGNLELEPHEKINFKFLKAGMGFFSSGITAGDRPSLEKLEIARLQGIEQALRRFEHLSQTQCAQMFGRVARLELPFCSSSHEQPLIQMIIKRVESMGLIWGGAANEDCLKAREGYINALTNCADPHAAIGNEGGHTSVDATVSSNAGIEHFIAAANPLMQCRASTRFLPSQVTTTATQSLNITSNSASATIASASSAVPVNTDTNDAALIKYIKDICTKYSIVRGAWVLVNREKHIEVGIGKMSNRLAIANKAYHIEIQDMILIVFDKINRESNGHYRKITDLKQAQTIIDGFKAEIPELQPLNTTGFTH